MLLQRGRKWQIYTPYMSWPITPINLFACGDMFLSAQKPLMFYSLFHRYKTPVLYTKCKYKIFALCIVQIVQIQNKHLYIWPFFLYSTGKSFPKIHSCILIIIHSIYYYILCKLFTEKDTQLTNLYRSYQ